MTRDIELVLLTVNLDGSIQAETKNILGPKCLATISQLEELLDAETMQSEYTKDFFDMGSQETNPQEQTNGNT
jgi:hypothetical protein